MAYATAEQTAVQPSGMLGAGARSATFRYSHDLHIVSSLAGPQAESIRALRTFLVSMHLNEGRRALAICSASRLTGSTYIAANLAAAVAQLGVKTLLIDGNLREPGVDSFFIRDEPAAGLTQYLTSDSTLKLEDVLNKDVLPNLSVIFGGSAIPQAQELLGNHAFKNLIEACVRDYDFVVMDTPPANLCADGRLIASSLRYALVVGRRNHSFVKDIRTMASDLTSDRVKIIGTYLNDV